MKEDDITEEMTMLTSLSRIRPESRLPYRHEETRYRKKEAWKTPEQA
jgi:hypothetical protein